MDIVDSIATGLSTGKMSVSPNSVTEKCWMMASICTISPLDRAHILVKAVQKLDNVTTNDITLGRTLRVGTQAVLTAGIHVLNRLKEKGAEDTIVIKSEDLAKFKAELSGSKQTNTYTASVVRVHRSGNKIVGYSISDGTGNVTDVASDVLKKSIRTGETVITNLTLTSDGRLIPKDRG